MQFAVMYVTCSNTAETIKVDITATKCQCAAE